MKFMIHIAVSVSLVLLFNGANAQTLVPGSPCQLAGDEAATLMEKFDQRISPNSAANTKVCAQINTIRVVIWTNKECLGDPQFSSAQRTAIRAQIALYEENLDSLKKTHSQLSSSGSDGCECWSTHCADTQ